VVPITLVVRKRGAVPDLTLADLPGITRVPVKVQPGDIYDQIVRIIRESIAPKESIILNVLSATVDFPTCESIRMSQQVDRTGGLTLAVVTKVDGAHEGLLARAAERGEGGGLESRAAARLNAGRLWRRSAARAWPGASTVHTQAAVRRTQGVRHNADKRRTVDL
jgi:hypothetical protein